jgi:hypothetical protein
VCDQVYAPSFFYSSSIKKLCSDQNNKNYNQESLNEGEDCTVDLPLLTSLDQLKLCFSFFTDLTEETNCTEPSSPSIRVSWFQLSFSIRVVKAMQLGMTSTSTSNAAKLTPYVIVEVDEPGKYGATKEPLLKGMAQYS